MAKGQNTEAKVEVLVSPIITDGGFELVDVEFIKEGPNWYLRIYADKDGGITIDDCEAISRSVEKILDEKDIIEQAYILEVSSPGIDRPLKKESDFKKYSGEIVDIKLYKPLNGSKEYQCELICLEGDIISVKDENGSKIDFNRKDVASIRLAVV